MPLPLWPRGNSPRYPLDRRLDGPQSRSGGDVEQNKRFWEELICLLYLVNCCWPSPSQSFLVPSPAGLMTIFYCLRPLGVVQHGRTNRLLSFHYILSILDDTDRTGNTASNSSPTVACALVAAGTCLPSRCLATIGGGYKDIETARRSHRPFIFQNKKSRLARGPKPRNLV
jgi:hypothetical protein